jgi:hypothetical protein
MGIGQSKQKENKIETIGWNDIDTDNISLTHKSLGLSKDAKKLAKLNISNISNMSDSEMSDINNIFNIFNKLDTHNKNKILEKVSYSENLSDTSPFISSEMYDYLVNSNTTDTDIIKQSGGSKKSKSKSKTKSKSKSKTKSTKNGGALSDDSSDTSSTSDVFELNDITDDNKINHKENKNKENKNKNKEHKDKDKDKDSSELSGGEISYLSSSAHTNGTVSSSDSSAESSHASSAESSPASSAESSHASPPASHESSHTSINTTVSNENLYKSASLSINTDNINMVSDY